MATVVAAAVNPALARLGLGPGDRAVVLHADDVGMCHATVPAVAELVAAGTVSSASVMVPCPWAGLALRTLAGLGADVGVHATLTAEWPLYRWSPLTAAAGLRDAWGRFPATVDAVRAQASPAAVAAELAAQLDLALSWGPVSHVDAHMGALADPAFLPVAVETALARRVLPVVPGLDVAGWVGVGLDPAAAAAAAAFVRDLEERGVPTVDHVRSLPLEHADDHRVRLLAILDELPPGLCHLICHPAADTPELRALADDWAARVADLEALRSPGLAAELRRRRVTLLPYAALRDLLPG